MYEKIISVTSNQRNTNKNNPLILKNIENTQRWHKCWKIVMFVHSWWKLNCYNFFVRQLSSMYLN